MSETDLQPALVALTDRLLERVAAMTADVAKANGALDPSEVATAHLLLADLALVAQGWRALQTVTVSRLDSASRELEAAAAILERALSRPSV